MTNDTHPLIDLMSQLGLETMITECNYALFTSLKAALIADGQPTKVDNGDDIFSDAGVAFDDTSVGVDGAVLRYLIKEWAISTLSSMVDEINDLVDESNHLSVEVDGYLYDAKLVLEPQNSWDEFVAAINSDIDEFKAVLSEWSQTLSLFANYSYLTDALDEI